MKTILVCGVWAAVMLRPAAADPVALDAKNPHYFRFQGKTVALITSGEHYGAVLNGEFNFRRYLEALAANKLNYTRLFGGSYIEVPGQSFGILRNDLAPAAGRFIAPWESRNGKLDLARWNAAYFARFHDFLGEAARRGIVVELTLFSSHYGEAQWKLSPFNPANNVSGTEAIDWKKLHTLENGNILEYQEQYTRKLVREANSFDNVIFEIQNEPWSDRPEFVDVVNPYLPGAARNKYPNSVEVADALSLAWQARVAEWITSEEARLPGKHLIAQNYCNFRFAVRRLVPGVSVVNFHYAYPEAVRLNYGLGKALSYDETGFLGSDDDAYRKQAWNFMLSGGSVFDNLDYSFSPGHEDGSDPGPNGPGGGSARLRGELRVLREFLDGFALAELHPDANAVKHTAGASARILSHAGHEYAIYLDGNSPAQIQWNLPPGVYSAEWVDTTSGAVLKTEQLAGHDLLSAPEFMNGIALRLRRLGR